MKYIEKIIDVQTGTEELKPYSDEQIKESEELLEKYNLEAQLLNDNLLKKKALFEKLGITEEEAKLLLS